MTQVRLYFSLDDNNHHLADFVRFISGDYSSSSYRPQLIITYTIPQVHPAIRLPEKNRTGGIWTPGFLVFAFMQVRIYIPVYT